AGIHRFVHRILDQRTIQHRQHFLGHRLGGRQKTRAQTGHGENNFAQGLAHAAPSFLSCLKGMTLSTTAVLPQQNAGNSADTWSRKTGTSKRSTAPRAVSRRSSSNSHATLRDLARKI